MLSSHFGPLLSLLSLIYFSVFDFRCQPHSDRASLVPAAGGSPEIFGTWLPFRVIHSPCLFLKFCFFSAYSPRWRRKIKKHGCPEMQLSNSHQLWVDPQGKPWEFKTRILGQNQEMHHCPSPPLSQPRVCYVKVPVGCQSRHGVPE